MVLSLLLFFIVKGILSQKSGFVKRILSGIFLTAAVVLAIYLGFLHWQVIPFALLAGLALGAGENAQRLHGFFHNVNDQQLAEVIAMLENETASAEKIMDVPGGQIFEIRFTPFRGLADVFEIHVQEKDGIKVYISAKTRTIFEQRFRLDLLTVYSLIVRYAEARSQGYSRQSALTISAKVCPAPLRKRYRVFFY